MLGRLSDNKEIDVKLEDNDNLNMPNTQSYIHAIKMIYIYWKQTDIINSLGFSVLFHLQNILHTTDTQGSLTNTYWYDIDLFRTNASNYLDLKVRSDINDTMGTIWKDV